MADGAEVAGEERPIGSVGGRDGWCIRRVIQFGQQDVGRAEPSWVAYRDLGIGYSVVNQRQFCFQERKLQLQHKDLWQSPKWCYGRNKPKLRLFVLFCYELPVE